MPTKPRKNTKSRFNQFSVGRGAVLFRKGASREQVIQHYLKVYGEKWGIHSAPEMEKYLFEPSRGMRPNFAKMFENRYPTEIEDSFSEYFKRKEHWKNAKRQAMDKLNQNPEFLAHRKEGVQKRESNEEFKRKRREQLASPAFKEAQRKAASAELTKRWKDPVVRARMIEDNRARSSAALKVRWSNPANRQKMVERSRKSRKRTK